jgi:hypothetical protein
MVHRCYCLVSIVFAVGFHLAANRATHEIAGADLSLRGITDAQALPGLVNQSQRMALTIPITAMMRC